MLIPSSPQVGRTSSFTGRHIERPDRLPLTIRQGEICDNGPTWWFCCLRMGQHQNTKADQIRKPSVQARGVMLTNFLSEYRRVAFSDSRRTDANLWSRPKRPTKSHPCPAFWTLHLQIGKTSGGCFGRDCRHAFITGCKEALGQNLGAPMDARQVVFQ